jgi:hypothetical protein
MMATRLAMKRLKQRNPVDLRWIAFGIAWALLGGSSLAGLGGLASVLIGLAWLAIGSRLSDGNPTHQHR